MYNTCHIGCQDGHLRVFDIAEGILLQEIPAHQHSISSLAVDPINQLLYSGTREGSLLCWSIDTLGPLDLEARIEMKAEEVFNVEDRAARDARMRKALSALDKKRGRKAIERTALDEGYDFPFDTALARVFDLMLTEEEQEAGSDTVAKDKLAAAIRGASRGEALWTDLMVYLANTEHAQLSRQDWISWFRLRLARGESKEDIYTLLHQFELSLVNTFELYLKSY